MNIGFVGLGIMGAPMASYLIDGGHQITTCIHNTPALSMLVNKGLTIVDSLEEVARNTDRIIIMVPDTPQVQEVLFGQNYKS